VSATGPYLLAEYWRRALALLLDGLIVGAAAVIVVLAFGAAFSVGFFASEEAGVISVIVGVAIGLVAFFVLSLLYAPVMMDRTDGQTLGKMALGIRVIRTSGEPMGFWWAAYREVAIKGVATAVANGVTFGLAQLLDYLWPLWDEENRALHDLACATRVVRA
jgi:uncharacterized RDD family membrane protein YckC